MSTRSRLMAAAADVFSRDGYAAASLDEIASVAGVTKGAIYANFGSKADLLIAAMLHRYRESLAAHRFHDAPVPASAADALRAYAGRILERIAGMDPGYLPVMYESQAMVLRRTDGLEASLGYLVITRFLFRRYLQLVASAEERGVDFARVTALAHALLSGAVTNRAAWSEAIDPAVFVDAAGALLQLDVVHRPSDGLPVAPSAHALVPGHEAVPMPAIDVTDDIRGEPLRLRGPVPTLVVVVPLRRVALMAHVSDQVREINPSRDGVRLAFLVTQQSGGEGMIAMVTQGLHDALVDLPAADQVLDLHLALDDGGVTEALGLPADEPSVTLLDAFGLIRGTAVGDDVASAASGLLAALDDEMAGHAPVS